MFSIYFAFIAWEIGPKNHSKGDVVMHHAIYKNYLYDKYLKKGYKLIVSVREPVAWFKSAVHHYRNSVGHKVNQLITLLYIIDLAI